MRDSFRPRAPLSQSSIAASAQTERETHNAPTATAVASDLAVLRSVIADLSWTYEALAVAMGHDESYRSHIWRVVNGERPMSLEFIKALPDAIETEWHARLAKEGGRVVVPRLEGDAAVEAFVAGAIGVLRPRLPEKADGMARMNLDARRKAAVR